MTDEAPAAEGPSSPLPKPFDAQWQFALTNDGTKVRIIIPTSPTDNLVSDMPASQLAVLHATMGQIIDHMRSIKSLPPVQSEARAPISWKVGRPNNMAPDAPKITALVFDEGRGSMAFLLLADLDALKIADAIERNVFDGMSENDKMKMIEEAQRPGKAQIIMPPVRKH